MHWIERFLDSYGLAVSGTDMRAWNPFDPFVFNEYYSDLWVEKLLKALEEIKARGLAAAGVSKTLASPVTFHGEMALLMLCGQARGKAVDGQVKNGWEIKLLSST